MDIALVPVGRIGKKIPTLLAEELEGIFNCAVRVERAMPEPEFAFDPARGQYNSTFILYSIMDAKEYLRYGRILGVFEKDMFSAGLNFVFGEAGAKAAVISLARLKEGFYGGREDSALFHRRVLTEAVHELGHTFGLGHCQNSSCVMFFSNTIADTDRKGGKFCPRCAGRLKFVSA